MKKTGKKELIIYSLISILLIGVLIISFSGQKTFFETFSKCTGGFQTMSLSEAKITYTDDGKTLNRILITGSSNNGGECLNLKINKNEISSWLNGVTALKDVILTVKASEQRASFPYTKLESAKYSRILHKDIGFFISCTQSACEAKGIPTTFAAIRDRDPITKISIGNCYCFYEDPSPVAYGGQLGSVFGHKTNLDISIDGVGSTNFVYPDKTTSSITDKATIKIVGSLLGNNVPLSPNIQVFWDSRSNQWVMGDSFTRTNYDNLLGTAKLEIRNSQELSTNVINSAIKKESDFNTKLQDNILVNKKNDFVLRNQEFLKDAQFEGDSLVLYYKNVLLPPILSIDVDAISVGIVRIVGKPEIKCAESQKGIVGIAEGFDVTIFNKGKYETSYNLVIECPNNVFGRIPARTDIILPEKNVEVSASISSNVESSDKCKVIVTDINRPEISASCFQSFVFEQKPCVKYDRQCDASFASIVECDGTKYVSIETCKTACIYSGGKPVCVGVPSKEVCDNRIDDDNDGLIDCDDNDCAKDKACSKDACDLWDIGCHLSKFFSDLWFGIKSFFNSVFAPLKMIMLIVLPLVSLIIVFGIGQDKFKLDKSKSLLLGLVVAGGVLGLVYFYFWAGLILGLLLLILKILL